VQHDEHISNNSQISPILLEFNSQITALVISSDTCMAQQVAYAASSALSVTDRARGGLGCLTAWHLPGGPVGPASRWAATSMLKLVKQLTPLTGRRYGGRGAKRARDKVTRRGKERVGRWRGPGYLARKGGLYFDICTGAHEFLVTPLPMGRVCPLSQSRFEEPFRSWIGPALSLGHRQSPHTRPLACSHTAVHRQF